MGMTGAPGRDSEADIDTGVLTRPRTLDVGPPLMSQSTSELETWSIARPHESRPLHLPEPHRDSHREPRCETRPFMAPNVFLVPRTAFDPPPPWAVQPVPDTSVTGKRTSVRVVRRRSLLPWFVGTMSFALTFGVLYDPVARRDTAAQLNVAKKLAMTYAQRVVARVTMR